MEWTLPKLPKRVSIREVGPRDGLQHEDVILTTAQKIALINGLADAGLRLIEVGSFVRPAYVPQMADTAEVFAGITRHPQVLYSAIVPNQVGARRAIEAGVDIMQVFLSSSESHNQSNVNMSIAQSLEQAASIATIARATGTHFEAVLSVVFGCPFEGDVPIGRVLAISERLMALGIHQLTLGDTTGMAHPQLVQQVIHAFQEYFPRAIANDAVPMRLHLHSARGAGLANVLAGLQAGVERYDASVGGIGGCPFAPGAPGNLCSEDLVHMLHEMGIETGIDLIALIAQAQQLEGMLGRTVPGQTIKAGICKHLASDGSVRHKQEETFYAGLQSTL